MDNWIKTTGTVLHGERLLPGARAAWATAPAQVFTSSPTGGGDSMQLMYLLAITAARAHDRPVGRLFRARRADAPGARRRAPKRGVKVRIIVPGEHIDAEIVRSASRARWGELLRGRREIYEYQPTMFHCKVLIVDGLLVSVGSTNFDNRSFRLNDEANLNIYDREFARRSTGLRARPAAIQAGDPRGMGCGGHGSRKYRRKFPPCSLHRCNVGRRRG